MLAGRAGGIIRRQIFDARRLGAGIVVGHWVAAPSGRHKKRRQHFRRPFIQPGGIARPIVMGYFVGNGPPAIPGRVIRRRAIILRPYRNMRPEISPGRIVRDRLRKQQSHIADGKRLPHIIRNKAHRRRQQIHTAQIARRARPQADYN